jgi:hypothetical protein
VLPAKAQRFFLVLPAKSPGKTGDYSFLPEKALVLPAKNFSATRESLLAFLIFFSATRESPALLFGATREKSRKNRGLQLPTRESFSATREKL